MNIFTKVDESKSTSKNLNLKSGFENFEQKFFVSIITFTLFVYSKSE